MPWNARSRLESIDDECGWKATVRPLSRDRRTYNVFEALLPLAFIVGMGQGNRWDETGFMSRSDLNLMG